MTLTPAEHRALSNGKRPISTDHRRQAAYLKASTELEVVLGELRIVERPRPSSRVAQPPSHALLADRNPDSEVDLFLDSLIVVSGGSGVSASKQAGVAVALAQQKNLAKVVVSSGGCIAWLPSLVGMNPADVRAMNAGAPSLEFMKPVPGLGARERVSLTGSNEMGALRTWFDGWMQWAGTPTFGDFRFAEGHPHPVAGPYRDTSGAWQARPDDPYRASIGLTVYDLKGSFPAFSPEQLDDPVTAREILKRAFAVEKPFGKMRQRFFPNDVEAEFPWLAESVDTTRISEVVEWSCRRWPAVVPKLLQDPRTNQIKMVFDGASLNTHPDLWMTGHMPSWSNDDPANVLVVRGKRSDRAFAPQASIDNTERPWHTNARITGTGFGPLEFDRLSPQEVDAMLLSGYFEGVEIAQKLDGALERSVDNMLDRANSAGKIDARPPLHGANLLLEDRTTRPIDASPQLGW